MNMDEHEHNATAADWEVVDHSEPEEALPMICVCTACGKIKGEHRGWDVSCEIHSYEVPDESWIARDPVTTRVIAIKEDDKEDDNE